MKFPRAIALTAAASLIAFAAAGAAEPIKIGVVPALFQRLRDPRE